MDNIPQRYKTNIKKIFNLSSNQQVPKKITVKSSSQSNWQGFKKWQHKILHKWKHKILQKWKEHSIPPMNANRNVNGYSLLEGIIRKWERKI